MAWWPEAATPIRNVGRVPRLVYRAAVPSTANGSNAGGGGIRNTARGFSDVIAANPDAGPDAVVLGVVGMVSEGAVDSRGCARSTVGCDTSPRLNRAWISCAGPADVGGGWHRQPGACVREQRRHRHSTQRTQSRPSTTTASLQRETKLN